MMRLLALLLALVLPTSALALSLGGIATPTTTRAQQGPTCTAVAGVGLRCSDGRVSSTVRAGGATCLDSSTVPANTPCVTASGMEAFASGSGGRTAADVHTIDMTGLEGAQEVTASFRLSGAAATNRRVWFWRSGEVGAALFVHTSGAVTLEVGDGSGTIKPYSSAAAVVPQDQDVTIRARWSDGRARVWVGGISVVDASLVLPAAASMSATMRLGNNSSNAQPLNGGIHSLTWSAR